MRKTVPVADREAWHAIRKKTVGASEVAALFGASPFMTEFQLWHIKAGTIDSGFAESDRMFWGNQLETVIAKGIAEKEGWEIRNVEEYTLHPTIEGMGASLDFEILKSPFGTAALEIKNIDKFVYQDKYVRPDETEEPPLHYQLQIQHQLACCPDLEYGVNGVLVGGNEHRVFPLKRRNDVIKTIEDRVGAFWESIKAGNEPALSAGDYTVVSQLYKNPTKDKTVDFSSSKEVIEACNSLTQIREQIKKLTETEELLKAELISTIKDAEIAIVPGYTFTYKTVVKQPYMVNPKPYRSLNIKPKKGESKKWQ